MWEEKVIETVSEIVEALRVKNPDCQRMIPKVRDLAKAIPRSIFKQVKPGDPEPMMNQKAVEVRFHLESLEAALMVDDIGKALEHAEDVLRVLHDQRTN